MKIYIATDHAGFELKNKIKEHLLSLGHEVIDNGPFEYNESDDYPDFIEPAARSVAKDPGSFGIILGGSGQGEAICANKIKGVRAGVYYGRTGEQQDASGNSLDMITSLRHHNNANILSIGARFINEDDVKIAIERFIKTSFPGEERHQRRIDKISQIESEG